MAYLNRECNYCGKKYYVCKKCEWSGSWKTVCCSRECYKKLFQRNKALVEPVRIEEGDTNMCLTLKDNTVVDVSGYDLNMGRFDCADGVTRTVDDFDKITLTSQEMYEVIQLVKYYSKE